MDNTLRRKIRTIGRVLLLLLITLLLHAGTLIWAGYHLDTPPRPDRVIELTMEAVPLPEQPVRLPAVPAAAPPPAPAPATPEPSPIPATDATTPADIPADDGNKAAETGSEQTPEAVSDRPSDGIYYKTAPPPSVALRYNAVAVQHDVTNPYYGTSTITWINKGDSFRIEGEARALFMTLLSFTSQGKLGSFGLMPDQYTEKPRRRNERHAYFDWQASELHFSESDKRMPLSGGEQDRSSLVWQLAAIGRGDPGKFRPDAVIDIFVAGIKEGEVWRVQVLREEDTETDMGKMRAWHVVRQPQPGTYDQRIDIWLAPGHNWYPVKIRYTEPNTDFLEMSVSGMQDPGKQVVAPNNAAPTTFDTDYSR